MSKVSVICRRVHDGDSIFVEDWTAKLGYWVRIAGIDAPEVFAPGYSSDQPFGREAGDAMRAELKGKSLEIDITGTDYWNRRLGNVYLDGVSVAIMAVRNGWAWAWPDTPHYKILKPLQDVSRLSKRGLWGLPGKKMRPATWRNKNRGREAADPMQWADEPLLPNR